MKRIKNKKVLGIAIFATVAVLAVGFTIAYNMDLIEFGNDFNVASQTIIYTDQFSSPSNWQPCQAVPLEFTVRNESNYDVAVRFKADHYWRTADTETPESDHSTTDLPITWDDNGVTKPMLVNDSEHTDDWTYNSEDGYYYYNNNLSPNSTTSSYFGDVMLDCNLNLVETSYSQDGLTSVQSSSDYSDATYHIYITGETIPADKRSSVWGN